LRGVTGREYFHGRGVLGYSSPGLDMTKRRRDLSDVTSGGRGSGRGLRRLYVSGVDLVEVIIFRASRDAELVENDVSAVVNVVVVSVSCTLAVNRLLCSTQINTIVNSHVLYRLK